jgi:hypothetical protein
MINTILIGNGYWGNIIKSKLNELTNLLFILDSKSDIDYILSNNKIDWVFVCSSTKSHYNIVKKCLSYNVNIFCEKPFGGEYKKSIEMFEIAKKKNLKIFVDNIFLYRNEFKEIEINKNDINEIKFTWQKKDSNYNENLYDSLLYHDIYMLIKITDDKWNLISNITSDESLAITLTNNNKSAYFLYNRNFNGDKCKKVFIDDKEYDFSNPTNDPLYYIISNINKPEFIIDNELTINTLKLIDKIKKNKKE